MHLVFRKRFLYCNLKSLLTLTFTLRSPSALQSSGLSFCRRPRKTKAKTATLMCYELNPHVCCGRALVCGSSISGRQTRFGQRLLNTIQNDGAKFHTYVTVNNDYDNMYFHVYRCFASQFMIGTAARLPTILRGKTTSARWSAPSQRSSNRAAKGWVRTEEWWRVRNLMIEINHVSIYLSLMSK